jgi:hypothetical protein
MAVKFKIGFTIDAETLFGLISKFLPLENLSVEEVALRPAHAAPPRLSKIAERVERAKPKQKRASRGMDLKAGVNRIMVFPKGGPR